VKNNNDTQMDQELARSLRKIQQVLADGAEGVQSKAADLITDLLDDMSHKSCDYQAELEDYIVQNPLKAVGIALGFGYLVTKILL
jgi:ElaB/YqjD/DUF883 family membrane-anchored ribosome-binding protein